MSEKVTAQHRYKWTLEEKTILSVCALACISAAVLALWFHYIPLWVGIAIFAFFGALFAWGAHVGRYRKKKSQLRGTYDPETTVLTIEGNGYDSKNSGPLKDTKHVSTKMVGPNNTLIFVLNDGRTISMPQRIGKALRGEIVPVLDEGNFSKDLGVAEWVSGLDSYKK